MIRFCEEEEADLLLIAGDLFHRQPLLRELKEVDSLFSMLSKTHVVLMAGNHDYMKPRSYYRSFKWSKNVTFFSSQKLQYVDLEHLNTRVYGLSYEEKEIKEPLYDKVFASGEKAIEILLAHGGDEKHIPIRKNQLAQNGFDYIALGHIHKPEEIESNRIWYSGALEPIDRNDVGVHGIVIGTMEQGECKTRFVPFAQREYVHHTIPVDRSATIWNIKQQIADVIQEKGSQHIYKILLSGYRDADLTYNTELLMQELPVIEVQDLTRPDYDFEKLMKNNENNLLGRYIKCFQNVSKDSLEYQALFEGVKALLETKREI